MKPTDERKTALDQQTAYLTLLPAMDEGFHTGYQTHAGIVSDSNTKPHEWLESVARNLLTEGRDVGYSIPDVLAGEAQLRRLMRLPYDEAMRHQELIDWRATLAVLLLWDGYKQDDSWAALDCENMAQGDGGEFLQSVKAALSPERAAFGLWLMTLSAERDGVTERRTLGMLSTSVAFMPAADAGDLSALLPPCVRWYDRESKRFVDPCDKLDEAERARLIQRLRCLQALNERRELQSPLYAADASLCGLIDRYIADLLSSRGDWRERFEAGDKQAETELYIRALAVYGLGEQLHVAPITRVDQPLPASALSQNPLLARFIPEGATLPDELGDQAQTLYAFNGELFALSSPNCLLEPANSPDERALLKRLAQEETLPRQYLGDWNRELARRFLDLANRLTGHVGSSRRVITLLREWSQFHANYREHGDRCVSLFLPLTDAPSTLDLISRELLDLPDATLLVGAFSDCLLLCEGVSPYADPDKTARCHVGGGVFAVPPISPELALWLTQSASGDELTRPRLPVEHLRFEPIEDANGRHVKATLRIVRKRRDGDAMYTNAIELTRVYPVAAEAKAGCAFLVQSASLPSVRCWPNARFAATHPWKRYFLCAQRPELFDVWAVSDGAWKQGEYRAAVSVSADGLRRERRRQLIATSEYPLFVALKRGRLSLGALPNDEPLHQVKRESAAAVSIDFGSNATTMMLRQGEQVKPAALPTGLMRTLLQGHPADDLSLPDDFLTDDCLSSGERPSTFVSAMDMFGDDDTKWVTPLVDGHIYYPPSLQAVLAKDPNTLYYDLKWSEESFAVRCLRLFLKQAMMQGALAARLAGSESVGWRASMPNAMPLYRQESYLETLRGLAREVSAETGVPQTQGLPPVLYGSENLADGLYFRSRNEVNARSGYLNMDVGGGTTDLSVWLGGASSPVMETSLLMGGRQILFDSLTSRRRDEFVSDFAKTSDALRSIVEQLAQAFGADAAQTHRKSLFLLDAFFADHGDEVRRMMADTRAEGRVSLLESVLLLNFGFLFRLCGELLDRCDRTAELHPQLCPRMEICVAGNGGRFLGYFDDEARSKLFRLALSGLNRQHPVHELLLVQSRHPKQEVAMGLLVDDTRLRSTVQGVEAAFEPTDAPELPDSRKQLLKEYLRGFYAAFPQAGEKLLGHAFEHDGDPRRVALTPAAEIELETILDNELASSSDFPAYIRAFNAVKRLWSV